MPTESPIRSLLFTTEFLFAALDLLLTRKPSQTTCAIIWICTGTLGALLCDEKSSLLFKNLILSVELGELPLVKTAANLVHQIIYSNKQLLAGMITAGWDQHNGGQVYSISLGGSIVRQPFAISGSGSTYIYGYCDAHFQRGMTRDECIKFVTRGT